MRTVRLASRDHDRTPTIYCIKAMAEQHYGIEVQVVQIEGREQFEGRCSTIHAMSSAVRPKRRRRAPIESSHSLTNVRDLRKISPLGRNDKLSLRTLRAFARVTPIDSLLCVLCGKFPILCGQLSSSVAA